MNRLIGRWVDDPKDKEPWSVVGFEGKNDWTVMLSNQDGDMRRVGIIDVMSWEDESQQWGSGLRNEDRLTCANPKHLAWNTAEHIYAWLNVIDLREAS